MLTKSETLKLIKSIGVRGRRLDGDIQTAAVASVFYSLCYGDVTIGASLLEHFPAGSRKAAIVAFLEHFGQFKAEAKTVVYQKREGIAKWEGFEESFAAMHENVDLSESYCNGILLNWTSFKQEVIASVYDAQLGLVHYFKKAEAEAAKGNAKNLEALQVVKSAYEGWMDEQRQDEELEVAEDELQHSADILNLDIQQPAKRAA